MSHRMKVVKWLKGIEPDYPGFAVLGSLFAQRGQYKSAITMYREALMDDPFSDELRLNLSFLIGEAKSRQEDSVPR